MHRVNLKESNVDKIIFLNYNQMYDKYLKWQIIYINIKFNIKNLLFLKILKIKNKFVFI